VATTTTDLSGPLTIQASGQNWTNDTYDFSQTKPTYTFFGSGGVGFTITDSAVTIDQGGSLDAFGDGVTLIQLGGSQNQVDIAGSLIALGDGKIAIDADAASDDAIVVRTTGSVTGAINMANGADSLIVDGIVDGNVTAGASATVSGVGTINGVVTGGVVSPGNSIGTLTVGHYDGAGSTLEIEVDGNTADTLAVVEIETELGAVFESGSADLTGATLALSGKAPTGDTQLSIVTTQGSIDGDFSTILDPDGILQDSPYHAVDLFTTTDAVVLAGISPATFDGVAAASLHAKPEVRLFALLQQVF
jgi:hypothetical protein